MSNISDYFSQSTGGFPEAGVTGVESEWMELCPLEVPVGRLWAGDPWVANAEDGCVVEVTPGTYTVSVKGMDFDGHRRTARLRVCLQGVDQPEVGPSCGETYADVGQIGACDMSSLEEAVTPEHSDEYMEDIQNVGPGMGLLEMEYGGKSFDMVVTDCGLGDGEFAVYPLKAGGKPVGLEVEFLPPGFQLDDDIPIIGE